MPKIAHDTTRRAPPFRSEPYDQDDEAGHTQQPAHPVGETAGDLFAG